jgi:hypothetical protein
VATVDKREGHSGRERGLADAALAHRHHHPGAGSVELIQQFVQAG